MSKFFRWSLSFRVFRLLSSSLLLYSQRFGRFVLWLFWGYLSNLVQSWLLASNNTEILNTYTWLWLTSDLRGLNKGHCAKFCESSQVWQTPEEGQRTYHIYPTPPLGQDMTQGQFFKRSLTGLNSEFFLLLD